MTIFADIAPVFVFLIVLGAFAVIAIIAFVIYRLLRPKLNRVLQPVEDEKVSKEIQDYKQNDDEDE